MPIQIKSLDHWVLTVASIEATVAFYQRVLNMGVATSKEGRKALTFGTQKLNLHQKGHEFEPKAALPTPGSGDFCLLTDTPLKIVLEHLAQQRVPVEEGPVQRTGATGALLSVYFRDPDHNLVEVSNLLD